jgi:hypothetical protein
MVTILFFLITLLFIAGLLFCEWQATRGGVVDFADFNPETDGVTDVKWLLQSAVDIAKFRGVATVHIPSGKFSIGTPITIGCNATIKGE